MRDVHRNHGIRTASRRSPFSRETSREPSSWEAAGAQRFYRESAKVAIPLGIAIAAAVATFSKAPQKVLSTMWISFAVVGTAAVIALSKNDGKQLSGSP